LCFFFHSQSVYQLFFYENEEQRDARDYQEQQRFFRAEQDRQRQREAAAPRNQQENGSQEEQEQDSGEQVGGEAPKRGFFGTIYFLVCLFFISLYPSYEFVPSHRRVVHEHQE
jgi:hypothetical protein